MDHINQIKYIKKNEALAEVDWPSGVFLPVDKPLTWTSFDVVNKLRYRLKQITGVKKFKVGHAGTLDPLATGMLIIGCGKGTKSIEQVANDSKKYEGVIQLGGTTPSYDAEMEVSEHFPTDHITDEMIAQAEAHFTGVIDQKPPIFSAVRQGGRRLYQMARKGQEVEIKSRQVEIISLNLMRKEANEIHFQVHCSKGTYIRSLAYDIGQYLNSGAYLKSLTRTYIGDYSLKDAWCLETLVSELEKINNESCQ